MTGDWKQAGEDEKAKRPRSKVKPGKTSLEAVGGASLLDFKFGTDRRPKILNIAYRVPEPATKKQAAGEPTPPDLRKISVKRIRIQLEADIVRSDKEKVVRESQIWYRVSELGSSRIRVSICIDPDAPPIPQGAYIGSLDISGPRLADTSLSITASLRYAHVWPFVGGWVILAGFLGLLLKVVSDVTQLTADPNTGPANASEFWPHFWWYVKQVGTWVWIGFGLSAIAGAYYITFVSNPTFGGDIKDWGVLFVAVVGAAVSGSTGPQAIAALGALKPKPQT
ncbi:MAG TPA: hypothetical protein VKA30_10810 [Actinomycetota bacterium]|nr:hypothetical protein [Actinomycetota bacterium]